MKWKSKHLSILYMLFALCSVMYTSYARSGTDHFSLKENARVFAPVSENHPVIIQAVNTEFLSAMINVDRYFEKQPTNVNSFSKIDLPCRKVLSGNYHHFTRWCQPEKYNTIYANYNITKIKEASQLKTGKSILHHASLFYTVTDERQRSGNNYTLSLKYANTVVNTAYKDAIRAKYRTKEKKGSVYWCSGKKIYAYYIA